MTTVRLQSRFRHSIRRKITKDVNSPDDIPCFPWAALGAFTQLAALWGFFFSSPHFGVFHTSHSAHEYMFPIENAYRC